MSAYLTDAAVMFGTWLTLAVTWCLMAVLTLPNR